MNSRSFDETSADERHTNQTFVDEIVTCDKDNNAKKKMFNPNKKASNPKLNKTPTGQSTRPSQSSKRKLFENRIGFNDSKSYKPFEKVRKQAPIVKVGEVDQEMQQKNLKRIQNYQHGGDPR